MENIDIKKILKIAGQWENKTVYNSVATIDCQLLKSEL